MKLNIRREPKNSQNLDSEGEQVLKPKVAKEYYDPVPVFNSIMEKYLYYSLKYKIEVVLGILFVLFVFNFFLGKRVNVSLARAFHARTLDCVNKNFAHLGFGQERSLELG